MPARPNVLVLMMDQCRADVFDPEHPCRTPQLDRLAARGVRITRAHTTNPVCSPARASLMTGLLPTRHKVRWVTHTVDPQLVAIDRERPQWAQRLRAAGYRTGYFGKWHVDREDEDAYDRGWEVMKEHKHPDFRARLGDGERVHGYDLQQPGYGDVRLYGVFDRDPRRRGMGVAVDLGIEWIDTVADGEDPWCCMVSLTEPHDPFDCGREAYVGYPVDEVPLSPSADDDLADRPGLYRKCARIFAGMSEQQHREARACYWASIGEVDAQFGRILAHLEERGDLENTIVVVTSDHGEHLGDHGIYTKNIHAGEGVYAIPLIMSGPGIAITGDAPARVGIHAIGSTLLELCGCEALPDTDVEAFTPLLRGEAGVDAYQDGYAENEGSRWNFTQRIVWRGDWKLVVNGFDEDELYDLASDPHEMHNRIADPDLESVREDGYRELWRRAHAAGDHTLVRTGYPPLRLLPYGPQIG